MAPKGPLSSGALYMPPIRPSNFTILMAGMVAIVFLGIAGVVISIRIEDDANRYMVIVAIFGFCTLVANQTFAAHKLAGQNFDQNQKTRHDIKSDMNFVSLQNQENATQIKEVKHEVQRLANYQNGRLHAAVNAASDAVEEEGRSLALNEEGINRLRTTWMKTMQDHLTKSQVSNDEGT